MRRSSTPRTQVDRPSFGLVWRSGRRRHLAAARRADRDHRAPRDRRRDSRSGSGRASLGWLLLLEAATVGSFASLDVLLFFLFFELTLVPAYFLIAGWGDRSAGPRRGDEVLRLHAGRLGLPLRGDPRRSGSCTSPRCGGHAHVLAHRAVAHAPERHGGRPAPARASPRRSREVAALPLPHLVAGRVLRGPHRGLGGAGARSSPSSAPTASCASTSRCSRHAFCDRRALAPRARVTSDPLRRARRVRVAWSSSGSSPTRRSPRWASSSSGRPRSTRNGVTGAVLLMFNHGIIIAALFLLVGFVAARTGTTFATSLRGLQGPAPVLAAAFTVAMLASIGLPGLSGFVERVPRAHRLLRRARLVGDHARRSAWSSRPSTCSGPTSRPSRADARRRRRADRGPDAGASAPCSRRCSRSWSCSASTRSSCSTASSPSVITLLAHLHPRLLGYS